MTTPRASRLAILLHHRWAVPVLAILHASGGCKFVALVNRLGVSRDSLRQTLRSLIEHGFAARNPGHGHPMRPEYILTRQGGRRAPWCDRLMRMLRVLDAEAVLLRKWSLPIVLALCRGRARFSEIKAFVPGTTARALTLALKNLQEADLVERIVTDEYPPATYYELTARGRRLRPVLSAF